MVIGLKLDTWLIGRESESYNSHTSHLVYENRGTGAPCAGRVEGEVLVYSSPGLQVCRVPVVRELPCILRRQVAKNSYPTNKLLAKDAV